MTYYIEDADGRVVGKFDGVEVDIKSDHDDITVDSVSDLPTVDEWDDDYLE
jgi:hypothetical protein